MSTAHYVGIDYHRWMMQDTKRTVAFRDALQALIKPGDVVVDVGAGTGILSLFAAEAGAGKVYAIEGGPICSIISKVAEANGFGDIIVPIQADARTVELPEQGDILMSDCMGHFVLSDRMIDVVAESRHLVKEDGIVIPNICTLEVAPGALGPLLPQIHDWDEPMFGFDFSVGRPYAEHEAYRIQISPGMLCGEHEVFAEIVIGAPSQVWEKTMSWTFHKPTNVDALVGWFTAHMGGDVKIETAPGIQSHWGQMAFPIPYLQAQPGERLDMTLRAVVNEMDYPEYSWWGGFYDTNNELIMEFKRDQAQRFNPNGETWHQ